MKKLKSQIKEILRQGIPNPNDEWSDGKYDEQEVYKYLSRLITYKMEEAFRAGRMQVGTKGNFDYKDFADYMETQGVTGILKEFIYKE